MNQKLQQDPQASLGYSWHSEELHYKGFMYLRKQLKLKYMMLSELHASLAARHSGFTKTYERVKHYFFWDNMKEGIPTFVVECNTCQCNKGEIVKAPSTLQPLSIPPVLFGGIFIWISLLDYLN
jgi:hypothetical protein